MLAIQITHLENDTLELLCALSTLHILPKNRH
ncbi:hypothetical protein XF_0200 [Xylella fastidiosa 9a5c]|uniref:Uncharacterized protein n=1 Tax=Xylella fastidiosa (strain 9a5c) TaxID=160492 RepID=Q9PGU8_XYLFA|nr:hypothetical protein XF_0200 [Xylella fastidiosa 9a5c]